MGLEDTLNKVKRFLGNYNSKSLLGSVHDQTRKLVGVMEVHFKAMDAEDTVVSVGDDIIGLARDVVSMLKHVAVERSISKGDSDYLKSLVLLLHNWNSNVTKIEEFNIDLKLIDSILSSVLSIYDLNNIAKIYIQRFNQMRNNMIPSVELAKHYAKSFSIVGDSENAKEE